MNVLQEGVLLLCCRLGDAGCKPLTMAQFRELGERIRAASLHDDTLRDLTQQDLVRMGYDEAAAQNMIRLLERPAQLEAYLQRGERMGIYPITRLCAHYPSRFVQKQAMSRPPVLFAMGDISLLERPAVAVIGSRQLRPENEAMARTAGRLAAEEGFVLVSGGARGADTAAQQACLEAGGSCVIFPADALERHRCHDNILYVCPDGYDIPFSSARAMQRNRLIHMLADKTVAVQSSLNKGGTWQGCLDNLRHGWSELYLFDDRSDAARAMIQRGATGFLQLSSIRQLQQEQTALF